MRRRAFLACPAAAIVCDPVTAWAQANRVRRVGVLSGYAEADAEGQMLLATFQQGLAGLGWIEGRNVHIDYRRAVGSPDAAAAHAADLVRLEPDVILTTGGTALVSVTRETKLLPVVFVTETDPVALGLVASLARPGGNATGFTSFDRTMGSKWLQMLKEIAPDLARVAILRSSNPQAAVATLAIEGASSSIGLRSVSLDIRDAASIAQAIGEAARERQTGLLVLPGATALSHRDLIVALAAQHRLPALYTNAVFSRGGGLLSYGIDRREPMSRAAGYVARILRGERPADLPVQTPTVFELVVNARAANALGLSVPPHLRALASEVIE